MKALLKILYFFLVLFVMFIIAGVFLPKSAHLSSSIKVNSSPEIIFDQLNNLKNWDNWSPWQNEDSTIIITYGEVYEGNGSSYSLISDKTGLAIISIIKSNPFTEIIVEMDFGAKGKATSNFTIKKDIEGTLVNWDYTNSQLKYFERYFLIFFKKNMLHTFNSGLERLRETSEDLRLDRISEVKETAVSPILAMTITDSSKIEEMDEKMNHLFGRLKSYLERRKIEPVDMPFTIFLKSKNENIKAFTCGFPIAERTWSWQDYQYLMIDSCNALKVTHWGKYGSVKPFIALNQYMIENNLVANGFPWEVYITDPENEADTSKWQTDIYFPVKSK